MPKSKLIIVFLLVLVVPAFFYRTQMRELDSQKELQEEIMEEIANSYFVDVIDQGTIQKMELDAYILGVLLGEVPADFEFEALKAQAVASRTYTLRRIEYQKKHDNADVCTDATCCQAFVSIEQYLENGGKTENLNTLRNAVEDTSNQVLMYQGGLIEATYFSCSGGYTEDAKAVWGSEIPYLQSVSSPGEESSSYFEREYRYPVEDFKKRIGLGADFLLAEDDIRISHTTGGGVDTISFDDQMFSGTQLRKLLQLPSTVFSISILESEVVITTRGYGHRVGMSQYGADAMAVAGYDYREILAHYYPGTILTEYS